MSSRLTVGTERLDAKPPRGNPPCVEPYLKGANILRDPGFELHLANTGGGPYGDEIPAEDWRDSSGFSHTGPIEAWSDGTWAPQISGWAAEDNYIPYVPSGWLRAGWTVSNVNPRSGTYHARTTPIEGNGLTSTGNPSDLRPITVYSCDPWTFLDGGGFRGFAARVEPGDFVGYSFWAAASNVPTDSTPILQDLYLTFFSEDLGVTATVDWAGDGIPAEQAVTTSYKQYGVTAFAPALSYLVTASSLFNRSSDTDGGVALMFDVDDCVLEVT